MKQIWGVLCILGSMLFSLGGYAEEEKSVDAEWNFLISISKEIPSVNRSGPLAVANLNLNREGNVVIALPGQKIFSTLNFCCDALLVDPDSLNQIVIGYSEIGPQKCIFNELGYRCGEGIASFFLEAPQESGIYEIQCRLDQAYSPKEAMDRWWEEDPIAGSKMTIGKIIVW